MIALFLASCHTENYRNSSGIIWNTIYNITYQSDKNLDGTIIETLKSVESSLSPFDSLSTITAINNNLSMKTDSRIDSVFKISLLVNEASGGLYDPTVGPLTNLWGFGYKNKSDTNLPTNEEIDSVLRFVGIRDCLIDNGIMNKKNPSTQFNFSSVTKGYGCDMVGESLRQEGVRNYMIEIGGEISLAGKNSNGSKWHIQIDAPIAEETGITHTRLAVIEVTDCGIATSGNYRNFKKNESGNKYGHILSPLSGKPETTDVLSATVIAPTCALADAIATACMLMPSQKALEMVEKIDDTDCLLVTSVQEGENGFKTITSSGFPKLK